MYGGATQQRTLTNTGEVRWGESSGNNRKITPVINHGEAAAHWPVGMKSLHYQGLTNVIFPRCFP